MTGSGKIMRRKCGKQHLLGKKNAKRRNRLSKSVRAPNSFTIPIVVCGLLLYLMFSVLLKLLAFSIS